MERPANDCTPEEGGRVTRPLKRWRLEIIGRAAALREQVAPADESAKPLSDHGVSMGPERDAAPAA